MTIQELVRSVLSSGDKLLFGELHAAVSKSVAVSKSKLRSELRKMLDLQKSKDEENPGWNRYHLAVAFPAPKPKPKPKPKAKAKPKAKKASIDSCPQCGAARRHKFSRCLTCGGPLA